MGGLVFILGDAFGDNLGDFAGIWRLCAEQIFICKAED